MALILVLLLTKSLSFGNRPSDLSDSLPRWGPLPPFTAEDHSADDDDGDEVLSRATAFCWQELFQVKRAYPTLKLETLWDKLA